jgi:hypothetical protein
MAARRPTNRTGAVLGAATTVYDPSSGLTLVTRETLTEYRQVTMAAVKSVLNSASTQLSRQRVNTSTVNNARNRTFVCVDTQLFRLEQLPLTP